MATLKSSLELSLVDNVSSGARRIDQNLENLRNQQRRNVEMFNKHRNAMIGAAAVAVVLARTLTAPVQASIEFSKQLEDIRQKADMSSEAIEKLGRASRDIGLETGQGATSIAGAIDSMVGSGAVTPDQAVEIATPLGKTAKAYGADPTELAAATSAMLLQFGIAADEVEKVYDIMAVGGKQGNFELKDMAAQFPGILANAKSLGIEGEKGIASIVAWLQIARRGTADGATAANNMSNFMGKIMAPDAIKNFKEAGVDVVVEMRRALENGVDPIEHMVGIINKLTDNQRDKLGELFADKQVTDFLLQATTAIDDYRKIREAALTGDGTVERDFIARSNTPAAIQARFAASMNNLNIALGDSLIPAITDFAKSVTPMIDGVADFVDANQELVAAVVQITAALVGLKLLTSAGGMLSALLGMNANLGNNPAAPGGGLPVPVGAQPTAAGKNPLNSLLMYMSPIIAEQIGNAAWDKIVGENTWGAEQEAIKAGAGARVWDMLFGGSSPVNTQAESPNQLVVLSEISAIRAKLDALNQAQPGFQSIAQKTSANMIKADLTSRLTELEAQAVQSGNVIGQGVESGLGAQLPRVEARVQNIMATLRMIAATGINIPVNAVSGGFVPGGVAPPLTRLLAGPRAERGSTTQHFTFGPTVVSTPTNASPNEISRQMAERVGQRMRAAHSDGGM